MVDVPGSGFLMGDVSVWSYPGDGEGPVHEVVLDRLPYDYRRPVEIDLVEK